MIITEIALTNFSFGILSFNTCRFPVAGIYLKMREIEKIKLGDV